MITRSISISCGSSTASLGASLKELLIKEGLRVILDSPAEYNNVKGWGEDSLAAVDDAFDNTNAYCILLLDRSYLDDKWFRYRRSKLLEIIFRRRGFVLPVQVGDDSINIHGLTHHLGKLKVGPHDAKAIADFFLQKISDIEQHVETPLGEPLDFEKILHLYDDNLKLQLVDRHFDGSRKIGYEFFRANDAVTNQNTNFILFHEGSALQSTIEMLRTKHAPLLVRGTNVVILPKERSQTRLETRLQNVASLFIDKAGIKVANVFYLDEFVWKHCTPSTFHKSDPAFAIRGFVEPTIDAPDTSGAISFVKNWYDFHPTSVLVIRGSGGVGKTTLTQAFSNYLINQQKKKILFIDDETICEHFLRATDDFREGFEVYDAYRALIAKSGEQDDSDILSPERFKLNFDNGNFLLIIDGLDQVIARLGNRFDAEKFLSSIYADSPSQRRKAIITSRSAFLTETYFTPQITAIDVLPFDMKQAEHFLLKRFPSLPKTVARGLSLASTLTRDQGTNHFFPFILDIVANLLQREKDNAPGEEEDEEEDSVEFASGILTASNNNDYVVYRVCAREQRKYPHGLTPDQQVKCLLELAVRNRGAVDLKRVQEFVEEAVGFKLDSGQLQALLAHPLLHAEGALMFSYDVVHHHFRNVFVGHLFRSGIPVSQESISLLAERNRFASDFLKDCVDRIGTSRDETTLRALSIIEEINAQQEIQGGMERSRAKTTVLLILLQQRNLLNQFNRVDATSALKEVFGRGNLIEGMALIDVQEKVAFSFRGTEIKDSEIVNFDHFWECEFDDETRFKDSVLKLLSKPDGLSTTARRANFDMNTCVVDQTVLDAIAAEKDRITSIRKKMFKDVDTFMRVFYKGGRLYPQREVHCRSKYRGSWDVYQLIKALKRAQIISVHSNPEKQTIGAELVVLKDIESDVLKFILEDHVTDTLRQRLYVAYEKQ